MPGSETTAIATYLNSCQFKNPSLPIRDKTAIILIKMVFGEAQHVRSIQTTNTYYVHRRGVILMPLSLVASDRPTYTVQFLMYTFVRRCFLSITNIQYWIRDMRLFSIKKTKCRWLLLQKLKKQCIVLKGRSIQFGNQKIK
jgi:hypothetical protein